MQAKLNEKNLQSLEASAFGDTDMGMATPACLSATVEGTISKVKSELPTLPLLQEAMKDGKNTYLAWSTLMIFAFFFCLAHVNLNHVQSLRSNPFEVA